MVFGSIVSSPRGSLSSQQALELANVYLETAFNTTDSDIALVLCHDTEVSLSQARKSVKYDKSPTVAKGIATTYIGLGKLLESRGHASSAQASFKKAEKLGGNVYDLARPPDTYRPSSIKRTLHSAGWSQDVSSVKSLLDQQQSSNVATVASTVPAHIFPENVPPPTVEMSLPEPDERLISTPQLVYCLGLLKVAQFPGIRLNPIALKWIQSVLRDRDEKERLHCLVIDVIRAFKMERIKDAKTIAEVVLLAPILDKDTFRDLLRKFYSAIDHSGLLNIQQLEGLARLIEGADRGYLYTDDFFKILDLLSIRLKDMHQQSSEYMHLISLAVSHVLDTMADAKFTDLGYQNLLQEPLSSYLSELKKSSDPFLVYQAAYAYQALLCVPDDETMWQAAMRRTKKVTQGASGLVGAVKGLDLIKFIEGLQDIEKGASGGSNVVSVVKSAYDGVTSLNEGGQGFEDSLKESFSFNRKRNWYAALRGADILIRDGELATFRKLVCGAPCRYDPAFQWGVCQRLGEMATNPKWDAETHQSAIALLAEIYRNDDMWGQQVGIKQWILNILMQLSSSSEESSHSAETLLQELEASGSIGKKDLFQMSLMNGPTSYPLKVTLPEPGSPSLLDRVQNRPDVEAQLRVLRRQRTKERGNTVYIPLQGKASLQAADDTRFPLMYKVKEFLSSDQKVFLLLGDSGAGKSAFSRELEIDLWKTYKSKRDRIPLRINLATIDKPELDMITKQLRRDEFSEPQIRELKHHRKFILICDGYDEIQQTHNLYMSNRLNQPGEWDAQLIISCRTEYLESDYRDRFQPGNRNRRQDSPLFQEAVIAPFSNDQVHDYIKQYVAINKPLWHEDDYKQALDLIPSLKDLVKGPFLMALALDVLPRMVDPGQHLSSTRVTRVALYDHFIEEWLERGKKRLAAKDMSSLPREAFEKLCAEGFILNGIGYLKKFAVAIYKKQGGHPVVEYSQLVDEGSWKDDFFDRMEKQLLHEACPLTQNGNQHQFIHKSLLEYSLARAVYDPQDRTNRAALEPVMGRRGSMSSMQSFEIHDEMDEMAASPEQDPNPNSPLVWRNFVNDYSLLQFLEERVQQEPVFKDQLLAYIKHSKKDKKWRKAAANAITILVRAGVQFAGTDLRGIQIPGADLSYGVFDAAQLQGADMRKVNLRGAWLRQTDLSGTNMMGVQFGELPYFTVDSAVFSCAFSPDGNRLAIGLRSGDIVVYSSSDWEIIQILSGHSRPVLKVVYSPDGNWMCSGGCDKTARTWDMESGVYQHILADHNRTVNCVAYSPHEYQVASASDDKTIRLWDLATGSCRQILSGHAGGVLCIAYSPEGGRITSGSDDFTVRLWDVASGECSRIFPGHIGMVWSVTFSPQGEQVASASHDRTIRLWDVESGTRFILQGHSSGVTSAVYSSKGDQVFSGSEDGTVRAWDVQTGTCRHTMTGHGNNVNCVAYSPKSDMIASGSLDNTVRLWDVSLGGSRHNPSGYSQEISNIKCSPCGDLIASCSKDHTIRLWDSETGTCQQILRGHVGTVSSAVFSPDGYYICSGGYDNTIRLWNVNSGICQHILTGHTDWVRSVAYSPQGDQVASASWDDTVRLWNPKTGEQFGSLASDTIGVIGVVYSPNGGLIATRCIYGTVRLWSVVTMACINTLVGHGSRVQDLEFSPRGDKLASAGDDCTVRLWVVDVGECHWILIGHVHAVLCVGYSYNGDLLASGSSDKTVRLWDVATGQCRAVVQNLQGGVLGVAWDPSIYADYLVTGCGDGSVHKWEVIKEGYQRRVTPCWSATSGSLTVTGASIQNVRGLTSLNKQLLKQHGVVGEPLDMFREASRKLITMASVVSQMRQPEDRQIMDSPSITDISDERQDEQQDEQQVEQEEL